MRRAGVPFVLGLLLLLSGCMVSEQVGEREHVNSPYPEEVFLHFHTPFNLAILFGRSALLFLVAFWAIRSRGTGSNAPFVVAGILCAVAAAWLLGSGWTRAMTYRLEVHADRLHLRLPWRPELDVSWDEIQEIYVEGMARNVTLSPDQPFWSAEWADLEIGMADGSTYAVDLRPLSVEQRGTFWRAIRRKAGLTDITPVSRRRR